MSIQFTNREAIFKKNQTLARHVFDWQQSCFDPSDYLVNPGESVWLEVGDNEATILNDAQAKQFNKEQVDYFLSLCDKFGEKPPEHKNARTFIAETRYESFSTFHQNIGKLVKQLIELLNWNEVLLISDSTKPYLSQINGYPAVQDAEKTLFEFGLDRNYSGGIIASASAIDDLFTSLFSIVRYNASAPYIFFSTPNSSIVGILCKYGNIHFEVYDERNEEKLLAAIGKSELSIVHTGNCMENFSDEDIINGRQLDLN